MKQKDQQFPGDESFVDSDAAGTDVLLVDEEHYAGPSSGGPLFDDTEDAALTTTLDGCPLADGNDGLSHWYDDDGGGKSSSAEDATLTASGLPARVSVFPLDGS